MIHVPSMAQHMITEQQSCNVIFPFSLVVDPMERLLIINFTKDPDSIYIGFEPQVFHDDIHGSGHLIIGWRTDKKVDVYHQKSLRLDSSQYCIAGSGLNKMIPVDMNNATFEITETGIQAQYMFEDIHGRNIEIVIHENNPKTRKPFGLLAPMGDAVANPSSLPLILLHDFYFVRKKQTHFYISIDNKIHIPDELPMPIDGQKMTFTRYSSKPIIARFNNEFHGYLNGFDVNIGQNILVHDDMILELEWFNEQAFIKSMRIKNNIHPITITFFPSFPNLNDLQSNTLLRGTFHISGHESIGSISGKYILQSVDNVFKITVLPINWKPRTTKLSTWFLFTAGKVFRKWPSTYQWNAELKKSPEGVWYMYSQWIRTGRIMKD